MSSAGYKTDWLPAANRSASGLRKKRWKTISLRYAPAGAFTPVGRVVAVTALGGHRLTRRLFYRYAASALARVPPVRDLRDPAGGTRLFSYRY